MAVNRRKHVRYPLADDKMFVLGRYTNDVAVVRNISNGGLQFEYVQGLYESDQWTRIDIICHRRDHIMVPCLRCNIVYDIKSLMEMGAYTGLDVRHCGLHFMGLTEDQKKNLHQLCLCLALQPAQ